jgi:hypothetical protein
MYKILIIVGVLLVLAGLIFKFAPTLLNWFGNLPGDIKYVKGNTKVFFPITSMLLVSVVISIVLRLIRRFYS